MRVVSIRTRGEEMERGRVLKSGGAKERERDEMDPAFTGTDDWGGCSIIRVQFECEDTDGAKRVCVFNSVVLFDMDDW